MIPYNNYIRISLYQRHVMSESDSDSSSSGSFGSSDDVDPPPAKPLWPLEVQINYSQDLERAKEQRAKYKEKLNKAGT